MSAPLTKLASSDSRKATTPATSSARPKRLVGLAWRNCSAEAFRVDRIGLAQAGQHHVGQDRAGRDGVDGDAGLAVFDRGVAGQADDTVLGRGVARLVAHAAVPADRGRVDDPPVPLFVHDLQDGGHAVEHAVEVDRQHPGELGGAVVLGEVLAAFDAGVVEEPVDAPEALDGGVDVALDVVDLRDVGDDGEHLHVRGDLGDEAGGLVHRGGIEVDEHEVGALGGQPLGGGAAQTGAGSLMITTLSVKRSIMDSFR